MPNIVKLTAIMLALLLAEHYAQAAEATVVNLSCDGTMTIVGDPTETKEPVTKIGLIVNLAAHTVLGFTPVARITKVDEGIVEFEGTAATPLGGTSSVSGSVDRVTGKTSAWTTSTAKDGKIVTSDVFDLVCKVTNRLF
jgi:hypothetical protein